MRALHARPLVLAAAALLGAAAVAPCARAQEVGLAQELYRDGQKLIAAGKTHEACLKFADSERADAALGTLIALAACHEREGKFASAWSEFNEAADLAERHHESTRARYARQHAAQLDARVHRVRIEVVPQVASVSVQLAANTYGAGTLGSAIPLDPGDYDLEVRAPGKKPWSRTLHVDASAAGEERIVVQLEDAPNEPSPAADATRATPPARPTDVMPERSSVRRTVGFVLGGVGLALGVGAVVLEAHASSLSSKADDDARAANAAGSDTAYGTAVSEHDDAVASQTFAIVAGAAGAVALGVGVALVLSGTGARERRTPASSMRVAPAAARGGAGLAFGGRW